MSLLLTVYNTPDWKALIAALQLKVLAQVPTKTFTEAAAIEPAQPLLQLNTLLSLLPDGKTLWIAVVQAELFLANALTQGRLLSDATKEWEQITSELLALHTQNRRKIKIVNLHQALSQPDAFCGNLAGMLPCKAFTPQAINSNLELLAACQYVAQNATIKLLNTRLQASAIALSESEILSLDIHQILDNARQAEKLHTELESTTKERDLILFELQKVQEQLEEYYLNLKAEQQRNVQYAKEVSRLDLDLRKAKAKAASTEFAGQLLQQELNQLKQSISWKAAKPVRSLGKLIRKPNASNEALSKDIALLLSSEYFDSDWYLQTYEDVSESGMNPAAHYLLHGATEGRLPGPSFDGNWYFQQYPDVATAGMNPLLHFILHGQQEGRSSSPALLINNSKNTGA